MNSLRFIGKQCLMLAASLLLACAGLAQDAAKQAVAVDLLVKGATIVTMDPQRHVIENGFLAVRGDEIIAIGQNSAEAFPKGVTAKETIDATGQADYPRADQRAHAHSDGADARVD